MRRTYTRAERDELIRAVRVRGQPVPEAAARLGVAAATAYNWLRRANGRGTRSTGMPAKASNLQRPAFARLVPASTGEASLVLRVGGAEIEVRRGFDGELLRAVVTALSGGSA